MRIVSAAVLPLLVASALAAAIVVAPAPVIAASGSGTHLVEFEKMTWVEVKTALAAGKTTALIYTGVSSSVARRTPMEVTT